MFFFFADFVILFSLRLFPCVFCLGLTRIVFFRGGLMKNVVIFSIYTRKRRKKETKPKFGLMKLIKCSSSRSFLKDLKRNMIGIYSRTNMILVKRHTRSLRV